MKTTAKLEQKRLFDHEAGFHSYGASESHSNEVTPKSARALRRRPATATRSLFPLDGPADCYLLDAEFPEAEQIPREFEVCFCPVEKESQPGIQLLRDGVQVGDILTDNSHADDGYRFHDVFHFTHAAVLGWSPMSRTLFACKRKSNPVVDVVEDGARAKILEELICALVFAYARSNRFLEGADKVDPLLLREIKSITEDREVRVRSGADWEDAILQGFSAWRALRANNGGRFIGNLRSRKVAFQPFGAPLNCSGD